MIKVGKAIKRKYVNFALENGQHYTGIYISTTAVYQWLRKFGLQYQPQERLIIESMSDTNAIKELRERVAELERLVGQKQVEVEFYKKMIDLAQDHYGIEIKKNFSTPQSATSGSKENNTHSA